MESSPMSSFRSSFDGSTQAGTQTGATEVAAMDPRVPGLTLLYHPDLERVGERALSYRRTC